MKNFFEGIKDLLAYDQNGMSKALKIIANDTNGVGKEKLSLTPPANYDKINRILSELLKQKQTDDTDIYTGTL